jgi:VWFA-related protein
VSECCPRRISVSLAVVIAFISLPHGAFQLSAAARSARWQQQPIHATTEIVKISVSVQDGEGNFLGGLNEKQFRVLDNGVERPIAVFSPDDLPAKIVVMIETSPAVYLIQREHLTGAYALIEGLSSEDQVALIAYDEAPRALLGFTSDRSAFATSLGQLQYTMGAGQLNLFDSISQVLDSIAQLAEKKAMVVLTTGLDSSPPERWSALEQKLRSEDVVIYPVALGGSLRAPPEKKKRSAPSPLRDPDNPLSFAKSTEDLREIAAITGGRAYFPEASSDFVPAYRQIAASLRHQYVLGIAPEHDGKFHSLEVQLLGADGQPLSADPRKPAPHIFARQGYFAPAY